MGTMALAMAMLVLGAAGSLVTHHRARNAVDLAALAAAAVTAEGEAACGEAAWLLEQQGARLVDCRIEGLDVVLSAEVPFASGLGAARASARAGPTLRAPSG